MYKVLKASVPSVRCSRVDEQILFIVAHRVAEIHVNHLPAMTLKLMADHPVEVLVVHGIVGAERGGIIVEDDSMVRVRSVVRAEVGDKRRNFALELDIERFEDIQAVALRLTAHDPVDVGIVVHTDANRSDRIDIRVRFAGGERRGKQIRPKQ